MMNGYMKKAVVLFSVLFLAAGLVSALTLSNSTFSLGIGYDYFRGGGKRISDASEFESGIAGASVYGFYDVQVGSRFYSRIEYCLYVLNNSFEYGSDMPSVNPSLRQGKSNKRLGGFVVLDLGSKWHLNLGGAVADISFKLTDLKSGEVYNRRFVGAGLILEGQYDFSDHLSLRLGVNPDYILFSLDSYKRNDKDGYSINEGRGSFSQGYSIGARLGMAYKF